MNNFAKVLLLGLSLVFACGGETPAGETSDGTTVTDDTTTAADGGGADVTAAPDAQADATVLGSFAAGWMWNDISRVR